jgi:hypothetical protein
MAKLIPAAERILRARDLGSSADEICAAQERMTMTAVRRCPTNSAG